MAEQKEEEVEELKIMMMRRKKKINHQTQTLRKRLRPALRTNQMMIIMM